MTRKKHTQNPIRRCITSFKIRESRISDRNICISISSSYIINVWLENFNFFILVFSSLWIWHVCFLFFCLSFQYATYFKLWRSIRCVMLFLPKHGIYVYAYAWFEKRYCVFVVLRHSAARIIFHVSPLVPLRSHLFCGLCFFHFFLLFFAFTLINIISWHTTHWVPLDTNNKNVQIFRKQTYF